MFRTPLRLRSSRWVPAVTLALLLPATAAQALPNTLPNSLPGTVPAPASTAGVLASAWSWLTSLFAPGGAVLSQEPPADGLDGASQDLMPRFFEGSHLDPNGG